ncbi:unnamed protein product [Clonostachys rosea]|uniref:Uncharacterized protein n=1 Tax=Bionectria ochroleuca TaxID=29856 RepID=A0ABY6UNY1_BIOOC|nr:unnamed protein product [Clonostachys rosea]
MSKIFVGRRALCDRGKGCYFSMGDHNGRKATMNGIYFDAWIHFEDRNTWLVRIPRITACPADLAREIDRRLNLIDREGGMRTVEFQGLHPEHDIFCLSVHVVTATQRDMVPDLHRRSIKGRTIPSSQKEQQKDSRPLKMSLVDDQLPLSIYARVSGELNGPNACSFLSTAEVARLLAAGGLKEQYTLLGGCTSQEIV